MNDSKKMAFIGAIVVIALVAFFFIRNDAAEKGQNSASFIMDTNVAQKIYGSNSNTAIKEVETELRRFEEQMSIYFAKGDITKINDNAGIAPVEISQETYNLLQQAQKLSLASENTFALTIAPLTVAWGITGDSPRVVPQSEIDNLLKLVDDKSLVLENGTAFLKEKGQAIDLGGIAKGTACDVAKLIYEKNKVDCAILNVGGSCIYVKGTKAKGEEVRIGFRNPKGDQQTSMASFAIKDEVFSTSGGYERFFEENGVRYHHILDPKTGVPAKSEIVSIGVMCESGTEADFLSTSLYVKGKDATIEYMKNGGKVIMLDEENNLYVSKALESSFKLTDESGIYKVIII